MERDTSRTRQPDTVLSSAVTLLPVRESAGRDTPGRGQRKKFFQHHGTITAAIRHFPLPTNVFCPADRSTDYLVDGTQNRADMCIGAG
jgi:hypothetical protein